MTTLVCSTTTAETIPNWITSIAALGTVIIAAVAAYYARKAWREAQRQANEAKRQADAAEQELHLTAKQVQHLDEQLAGQRTRDEQLRRRDAESRIDAFAPTILAEAEPVSIYTYEGGGHQEALTDPKTHELGDDGSYVVASRITITNVSAHPARICFPNSYHEFGLTSGREYVLAPGKKRVYYWNRIVSTAYFRSDDEVPELANVMRSDVWVRDLGVNMRDTLQFTLAWRFMTRDGSRVLVDPKVDQLTTIFAAEPIGPRVYERLDAGVEPASPLGALQSTPDETPVDDSTSPE